MKRTLLTTALLAYNGAATPLQKSTPETVELEARTRLEEKGTLDLQTRQFGFGGSSSTANDLVNGECGEVVFIFARGSTEPGNLGGTVGPALADDLRAQFPDLTVQGVDYAAGLATNALPGGGDPQGIQEMTRLWNLAATQCPDSTIVGGGYSQGAALTHRSVESLPANVQSRIAGLVTFGDTQRQQSGGQIDGVPPGNLLIICNDGDAVCEGSLRITAAHLRYVPRVPEAAEFLTGRVAAAGAGGGADGGAGDGGAGGATPAPAPAPEAPVGGGESSAGSGWLAFWRERLGNN